MNNIIIITKITTNMGNNNNNNKIHDEKTLWRRFVEYVKSKFKK